MKKRAFLLIIILIVGVVVVYTIQRGLLNQFFFDSGGRYDTSVLDDMGVCYSNRSDIEAFNEGYSESDNCPWGFIHNGLDYFFYNNSDVIAAAPGLVEWIELKDWGVESWQRYTITVAIRFNTSIVLTYGFEPITNSTDDQAQQLAMFDFQVGTWVSKGDVIAKFLRVNEGAHIHFGVYQNDIARDPTLYMSLAELTELQEMVHDFNPTWGVSYP